MNIDNNYYSTNKFKVAYVLSCLDNEIIIYIYYRREKNINNLYLTFKNVLNELISIYANNNRLENAQRSLAKLVIRNKLFKFFIVDFIRFNRAIKFDN